MKPRPAALAVVLGWLAPVALLAQKAPGVMIQATSQDQGSPFLRGFTGFRTLFLIDGIRLNNSVFRDGPNQYWTTVDPLGLERLEVVQGPASVLYGSDAIGGTVQALTFDPAASSEAGRIAGSLFYRYASAEHASGGQLALRSRVSDRWSLAVRGALKDFGDVRAGEPTGLQQKTGYGEWDGDLKAAYETAAGGRLILAHQQVRIDDAWRTHSTQHGVSWEGTAIGTSRTKLGGLRAGAASWGRAGPASARRRTGCAIHGPVRRPGSRGIGAGWWATPACSSVSTGPTAGTCSEASRKGSAPRTSRT